MKTEIKKDGANLTIEIEGSIDTVTAPELEKQLKASLEGVAELVLELSKVAYISSAGLRVILSTHKKLSATKAKMILKSVNDSVMEVFEMTGFADFLNFE